MKKQILLLLLFVTISILTHGQSFKWLNGNGSDGSDWGYSVTVHPQGFSFVSGWFSDTIQFGSELLISQGESDIFIAHYDSSGNFMWVKHLYGPGTGTGAGLCTDEQGNVFVTGWFTESMHVGNETLVSAGSTDIFVAMYSHAGNFEWAKRAGGESDDYGNRICLNIEGDVIVAGSFRATADFSGTSKTSWGNRDIFIANYSHGGNFHWVRQAGGTGEDRAYGVVSDHEGHIAVTGFFTGHAEFGSHNITSSGIISTYVAWCNPAGEFLWAKAAGGGANDFARGFGIGVDHEMNIYNTGFFSGNLNFTEQDKLSATGGPYDFDIYLSKYGHEGNLLWILNEGGNDLDQGLDLSVDSMGNIYTTGFFHHSAEFSGMQVNSHGMADTYVGKYNSEGQLQYILSGGSDLNDYGFSVGNDDQNNAITAGTYTGYCDFGSLAVPGYGNTDIFLLKTGPSHSFIDVYNDNNAMSVYPNPCRDYTLVTFTAESPGRYVFQITNAAGRIIFEKSIQSTGPGDFQFRISTGNYPAGIYYCRLQSTGQIWVSELVVE